jgi:hypothetical protein
MKRFPWTKQQDFCLRLGLLKVLVAILKTSRFGTPRDQIVKRLTDTLFVPAPQPLARAAEEVWGARFEEEVTRSEALLLTSSLPSWGQPILPKTAYKILDWGQNTGLVGNGYRITERGQLLSFLMDDGAIERFLSGDAFAWNPFDISVPERAYLFYHLGEGDELLWQLTVDLGLVEPGRTLSAPESYRFTLEGMKQVLARAEKTIPMPELPRFRTARELAETIEWELSPDDARPRRSRPQLPAPRIPGKSTSGASRKTRKNADHQAIPRFEQLVDLGFLTKAVDPALTGKELDRARKAWSFVVNDAPKSFREALGPAPFSDANWHWADFAKSFAAAHLAGGSGARVATAREAIGVFLEAYAIAHRPVGQTPFESVAILAMVLALDRGLVVEIKTLHDIMLTLKQKGRLQDQIFFAAGNEVDRMFIFVRPDFGSEFDAYLRETGDILA